MAAARQWSKERVKMTEDGGREDGRRRTEDGGRETVGRETVGRWDGGRRTEDGGRRTEDGGRETEDGGRETEDGRRVIHCPAGGTGYPAARSSQTVPRPPTHDADLSPGLSPTRGEAPMLGRLVYPRSFGEAGGGAYIRALISYTRALPSLSIFPLRPSADLGASAATFCSVLRPPSAPRAPI